MNRNISELGELIFAHYPKIRKLYRDLVSIRDIPISITQLTCLHILNQGKDLTMTQLASDLCMSNQQLTKVVDALAELNMVERVCDPNNRRKVYARLSAKGRELLASLQTEVSDKLSFVLRKMSQEEIDKLYDSIFYVVHCFDTLHIG